MSKEVKLTEKNIKRLQTLLNLKNATEMQVKSYQASIETLMVTLFEAKDITVPEGAQIKMKEELGVIYFEEPEKQEVKK